MDAFTAGLLHRIRTTQSDLTRARETGDEYLAEVEQAELEDLHRLAAEHGAASAIGTLPMTPMRRVEKAAVRTVAVTSWPPS
ncbi:hypothetical protein, partial [Streptomyces hydrogenans]